MAIPICRRLLTHLVFLADSWALARAGSSIEAKIAIIAMTTRSSIKVKPPGKRRRGEHSARQGEAPAEPGLAFHKWPGKSPALPAREVHGLAPGATTGLIDSCRNKS
jgi:hypothetical protein